MTSRNLKSSILLSSVYVANPAVNFSDKQSVTTQNDNVPRFLFTQAKRRRSVSQLIQISALTAAHAHPDLNNAQTTINSAMLTHTPEQFPAKWRRRAAHGGGEEEEREAACGAIRKSYFPKSSSRAQHIELSIRAGISNPVLV
ncbi:hypothetical protein F511_05443 [Dorcoceras hygrometricum]|uniref:Uncharacterized protein n=1 Tax=Dorcoceras hygrometricum TaxID=472368 RepID=A0A2Z7C0J2_9LAMI|nr:hypothetical protein F511_05443 [Dorcoceras hygrometricum]